MGAHIVGRHQFRHLRREGDGSGRVFARLARIIGVVVERVFAEVLLVEFVVVGIVVRRRRTRMGGVLEPKPVFQVEATFELVEFRNLQVHLCFTLSFGRDRYLA